MRFSATSHGIARAIVVGCRRRYDEGGKPCATDSVSATRENVVAGNASDAGFFVVVGIYGM